MPSSAYTGFRRQVVVRLDAEEWALLEAAAKEHGSQQAAATAALRALGGQGRHAEPEAAEHGSSGPLEPPPVAASEATSPVEAPEEGDWWTSYENLEEILGLKRAALKRHIAQSGAETRIGPGGEEARLDQLEVDTRHAAGLMGVSIDAARRRARSGQMGAVQRSGGYYFPLGTLEIGVEAAGAILGKDAAAVEAMATNGDLEAAGGSGRGARFWVLDVISLIE